MLYRSWKRPDKLRIADLWWFEIHLDMAHVWFPVSLIDLRLSVRSSVLLLRCSFNRDLPFFNTHVFHGVYLLGVISLGTC